MEQPVEPNTVSFVRGMAEKAKVSKGRLATSARRVRTIFGGVWLVRSGGAEGGRELA